jgi:hypothetical protein
LAIKKEKCNFGITTNQHYTCQYEIIFTDKVNHLFDEFKIVANKARQSYFYQATMGLIKSRNLEGDTIKSKA